MDIFIDTSAFVALKNINDQHHSKAKKIARAYADGNHRLITSNYIIAETLTVIARLTDLPNAIRFREEELRGIIIVRISETIEERAFDIFKKAASRYVSFIDCTCFALMREMNIPLVFGFDHHFSQYGFTLLQETS